MNKQEQAQVFVDEAIAKGYQPEISGSWVKWSPALPAEMIMDHMQMADEIAEVVKSKV